MSNEPIKEKKPVNIKDFLAKRGALLLKKEEKPTKPIENTKEIEKAITEKPKVEKKGKAKKAKKVQTNIEKSTDARFRFVDPTVVKDREKLLSFIEWSALPTRVRKVTKQGEFAKEINIDTNTLTHWKNINGFWDEVAIRRESFLRRYSSDVYYSLMTRARETGAAKEVELFAKLAEGFTTKLKLERDSPETAITTEESELIRKALTNIGLAAVVSVNASDEDGDE